MMSGVALVAVSSDLDVLTVMSREEIQSTRLMEKYLVPFVGHRGLGRLRASHKLA